ncbi:MAG: alanine racemase [Thermoleophilia bacterium]
MHRALATIDLGAVRANVAGIIDRLSRSSSLMAVVKADGYGHGAVPVARASLAAGATALGVATIPEALQLREAGIDSRILVMGPLTTADLTPALDHNLEILVWTLPFLRALADTGHAHGRQLPVHIKIDTGMRRLGLYPRQLPDYLDAIEASPEVALAGVMTHFATADEDEDFCRFQLRTFEDATQVVMRTGVRVPFHCANSAATLRYPETHFDMVRCGIAIYGLSPFQTDAGADGLTPALTLTSYLADIKKIREGDAVGYGRTWSAGSDTHIGLVPLGYGDGFSRRLSNRGRVLIGGWPYPVVGRVSMDQITVDLGSTPAVKTGDEVVLLGAQGEMSLPAEEMASLLETINYEVTCNLSSRVERRFSA